jgi:hypothetical protein
VHTFIFLVRISLGKLPLGIGGIMQIDVMDEWK